MKRIARLTAFLTLCLVFLIFALAAQLVTVFFSQRERSRVFARLTQLWARALLGIIGIRVQLSGSVPDFRSNHFLIVSNHQSYLDIVIIATFFPATFVAKKEVSRWPMLGLLARLGGTIFVNRNDARSGVRGAYRASRLLRDGISVQVFPESTTSDGTKILPFKALFFASAIRTRTQILPLTINFKVIDGQAVDDRTRDLVCWYGDMDFLRHFWDLLKISSAEVSMMVHDPIKPSRARGAKTIADITRQRVRSGFDTDMAAAVAAAQAEVPVEFAEAREQSQAVEQSITVDDRATDFIIGALLYSLFASNQSEIVSEMIPGKD